MFPCQISTAWGPLVSPLFVPGPALWLGGLKRQDTHGWFLTTCFGTSCAPGVNVTLQRHSGVIDEHVADEKTAEKRFHVGDLCVGVVWSGRGCRLGCGGCAAEV